MATPTFAQWLIDKKDAELMAYARISGYPILFSTDPLPEIVTGKR